MASNCLNRAAALPPLLTCVTVHQSWAFTIVDQNRDGVIDESDLRDTSRNDPEETILNAFKVSDPEGTGVLGGRRGEMKYHLVSQADKFTEAEIKQMFTKFPLDVAGNLNYKNVCYVITCGGDKELQ
ncbi:myosin regulatory light chain 10-like [Lates calcarifer]|uniref:Myosin regulatory light chain 10-like n=1 Tax=Lates calcarifer TaxID=8187 RepID=A0AAJ8DJK5_LATCA|nr:myosin regulatory light chain 10-like [Lates calcarifer]